MKRMAFVLSLFTLTACSKKNTPPPIPGGDLADFTAFINESSDASFNISTSTTQAAQHNARSIVLNGSFSSGSQVNQPGGPVLINSITLTGEFMPRVGYYYQSTVPWSTTFFGHDVPFDISYNNDSGNRANIALTVPASLFMTAPALNDTIHSNQLTTTPTVITWTADPTDEKNIIIECACFPFDNPTNPSQSTQINTAYAPDNGSYVLQPADLLGIPIGSTIRITIMRVAYTSGYSKNRLKKFVVYSQDQVVQTCYYK